MNTSTRHDGFIGEGTLYIRRLDRSDLGLVHIGNATEFSVSFESEVKERISRKRENYGAVLDTVVLPKSGELAITLDGFESIAARGEDMTALLRDIGDDEVTRTLLRFENSKAPDGSRWAPLKRARRLNQSISDSKPLMDTGELRDSITKQLIGSHAVIIGSDAGHSVFHQFGTRHIDARPFLGVSDDLINSVEELIHDYFIDI